MNDFPCNIVSGCNTEAGDGEPEHNLSCILFKVLEDHNPSSIPIESLCAILAQRYKFYYIISPYQLSKMIRNVIENPQHFQNHIITLSDNCVRLSNNSADSSLHSEDIKYDIKIEQELETNENFAPIEFKTEPNEEEEELEDRVKSEYLSEDDEEIHIQVENNPLTEVDEEVINIKEENDALPSVEESACTERVEIKTEEELVIYDVCEKSDDPSPSPTSQSSKYL